MARKPNKKSQGKTIRGAGQPKRPTATALARRSSPTPGAKNELAAAKLRIAQLEKSHAEVLRRLESAIAAVHKLLEN